MIDFKGAIIDEEEVLSRLKKDLKLRQVCYGILHQRIIEQVSQEKKLSVTNAEIQAEADRIRYENRLFRIKDTYAWLADQFVSIEEWEAGIRDRLLAKKLSEDLFAQEVEKLFTENPLNFDQVVLYRIVVPYAQLAQEISYEIEEGELSFYEAAHIYDVDQRRRYHCGYEGKLYRWSFQPELSAIIFSATPGHLIGPLSIDQASHLLMVEEFIPAELTAELYQARLKQLFDEWLTTELNFLFNIDNPID